jgi:hypothetical protein
MLLLVAVFSLLASACDLASLNPVSSNPVDVDPVAANPDPGPDDDSAPADGQDPTEPGEEDPADPAADPADPVDPAAPDDDPAPDDDGTSDDGTSDDGTSDDGTSDDGTDDEDETPTPPVTSVRSRPGSIVLAGNPVDNIRPDPLTPNICEDSSLPNGAGQGDKSGTCVPTQLGEVAPNPVRVTVRNPPQVVAEGEEFTLGILIADRDGGLDLNAFTFDSTGGAGVTFLEQGGELDENGRPLMHCHLGVATLPEPNGLPGETFDAAFLGLQGVEGDFTATISGVPAGVYRGVIYCSGPGHAPLATGQATDMQAIQTFDFEVSANGESSTGDDDSVESVDPATVNASAGHVHHHG